MRCGCSRFNARWQCPYLGREIRSRSRFLPQYAFISDIGVRFTFGHLYGFGAMNILPVPPRTSHARGAATIELLVVLPVLLITLAMGVDEARMMRAAIALDSAVQMGVLAGGIKLKEVGFDRLDSGEIKVKETAMGENEVFNEMKATAEADASDYTILVSNTKANFYRCRCPDPDDYIIGEDLVGCGHTSILDCADPMIYLEMTATTQVDMVFFIPGSNPHLLLSRTAIMCGQ